MGLAWASAAWAQTLETVVISVSGAERRSFDTPYAADVVGAEELRAAGPMVNLSEALSHLPGIVATNRGNYAQDLQINSRGFGARASFGVRGLRLYSDGIPASGPDGQGQVSHFDLAGAARVEVLRGPFTALYGSSSGGVIALVSAAPTERRMALDLDAGSGGVRQQRFSLAAPLEGGFSVRAQLSRLDVDGWRPQSRAERRLGNLRLGWEQGSDRVVLVLNSFNQPAQDPLGLTRAQFDSNPDQTTGVALPQDAPGQADRFNTRKNSWQDQAGLSWRHGFADRGALSESRVAVFAGKRSVTQWQSIPVATQFNAANPTLTERQPGGVIDFDRTTRALTHDCCGVGNWLKNARCSSWPVRPPRARAKTGAASRTSAAPAPYGCSVSPARCGATKTTGSPAATSMPRPRSTWPGSGRRRWACAAATSTTARATATSSAATAMIRVG